MMGAYIWRGDLTKGFLRYKFGGLIFGGAYTWRGLFSEFDGRLVTIQMPLENFRFKVPTHVMFLIMACLEFPPDLPASCCSSQEEAYCRKSFGT